MGYARISTDDQTTALQADALTRAAVDVVFEEAASGANIARPVFAKTLAALRAGDTLVVWRLDRLGRSLGHLIEVATMLREQGVFLRSLTEGFDTSTASGRLLYHVLGAVAEFEREVIKERTIAGMETAKKRGTHVGRPKALAGWRLAEAGRMLAAGNSQIEKARICGCRGQRFNGRTPAATAPHGLPADQAVLSHAFRRQRVDIAGCDHRRLTLGISIELLTRRRSFALSYRVKQMEADESCQ